MSNRGCPTERIWKCRKESGEAVSEWRNFFFILLSWVWIMEHHAPYQAFWRVGFYVSYQVERPEAQCHAVFLCRAHSLSANLCHPHIFLIRRDQDQLISHTKFPAQLLEQHPSSSERLTQKWSFNVKKKTLVLSGESRLLKQNLFCFDDLVYTVFRSILFAVMHITGFFLFPNRWILLDSATPWQNQVLRTPLYSANCSI